MNRYSEQRFLVKKNYDHTQRFPFQVLPLNLEFHFGIFARIMNHFSPVEDIEDVENIDFFLCHALTAMFGQSKTSSPFLGNPPYVSFNFLDIKYDHPVI